MPAALKFELDLREAESLTCVEVRLPGQRRRDDVGNAHVEGMIELDVDRAGLAAIDLRKTAAQMRLLQLDQVSCSLQPIHNVPAHGYRHDERLLSMSHRFDRAQCPSYRPTKWIGESPDSVRLNSRHECRIFVT